MRQTLTTDRLTLRPLTSADAAWFSAYAGAPEVARMTGSVTSPLPVLSAEFWIIRKLARTQQGLAYPYVMESDGKAIGMIDLFKRQQDAALELGYSLMPEYWGQGFMFEACEAVIEEAKHTLGAARIIAGVFIDNPASLRLLHKLGFTSARTHEEWFSMGRMEKAKGVTLTLDVKPLDTQHRSFSSEDDSTADGKDDGLTIPAAQNLGAIRPQESHDLLASDKIAIRA